MPAPVTPSIKSFLIADMVFRMDNGKWGIVGLFQSVVAPKFPTLLPSLGIFIRLADAAGQYAVTVHFQDSHGRTLAKLEGLGLNVKDRLGVVDFGFTANNLVVPAEGNYFFKLFFNDQEVIGDIPISASLPGGKNVST